MPVINNHQNIVFVADVHLKIEDAAGLKKILRFLEEIQHLDVKYIFILGDFFDFWVSSPSTQKAYSPVLEKFHELYQSGININYLSGNRDFLISDYYRNRKEVDVFDKPILCDLAGKRVYLGHGDELCLKDRRYQFYKIFIRHKSIRLLIKFLPGAIKEKIARHMSKTSRKLVKEKKVDTLAIVDAALQKLFDQGVDIVIHGHIHRTCLREIDTAGRKRKVYSLGDWSETGHFIFYNAFTNTLIQKQI